MEDSHVHVEPGDPRYDGFRITEIWVVVGVDPTDDQEGLIYFKDPDLGGAAAPLLAADERRFVQFVKPVMAQIEANPERTPYRDVKIKHFRLIEE